jgi:hypothetical protein
LQYEFAAFGDKPELMPLKILDHRGKVLRPDLGEGDPIRAFQSEIADVEKAIRKNQTSPILSGELAHDAIIICHKQTESVMKGRTVRV